MIYKTFLFSRACLFYIIFIGLSAVYTTLIALALPFPFKARSLLSRSWCWSAGRGWRNGSKPTRRNGMTLRQSFSTHSMTGWLRQ